jgi:hypothetical protein
MFELLVNGIPRTYRDKAEYAVDAGRILKHRDLGSEIIVLNKNTREWLIVSDVVFASPKWQPAAQAVTARAV